MKAISLTLLLLLAGVWESRAQLSVEAEFEDGDFLIGENIMVRVRIANTSGQKLQLGDSPDWLTFTLESRDGYVVQKMRDVPVGGEFTLENSEGALKRVNLSPGFALGRTGRYQVTVHLKVNQWGGRVWSSAPTSFSVVTGAVVSQTDFGVPRADGPPEIRRYSLLKSVQPKKVKLYFRLSDTVGARAISTYQIGSLMSFSKPETLLDRANNYHVLYQTGARTFLYFSANPEGNMVRRELWEMGTGRPKLVTTDEGNVIVISGVRRITREDYPPLKDVEVPVVPAQVPSAP
jgi:hypothetical protein